MGSNTEHEPTVFVLGAGFTKAFLPNAPLMIDDYNGEELTEKFRQFHHASDILDWERSMYPNGNINIERLLTRLDSLMPYDFDQGADQELRILSTEVARNFIRRIEAARNGEVHSDELNYLAQHCVANKINCVTFNYDDVFDEAVWRASYDILSGPTWNPDVGYGFFCRPSRLSISHADLSDVSMDATMPMLILKLHGSLNWRPRRGYPRPYFVDAIMHHDTWSIKGYHEESIINLHLEPDPFIIPPILMKSNLVEQPVLRLVWHRAFEVLQRAHKVVFIGYSFPLTDIAVRTLFDESLRDLPRTDISVVNFATSTDDQKEIIDRYQTVFRDIPAENFDFRGALEWSRELVRSGVKSEQTN